MQQEEVEETLRYLHLLEILIPQRPWTDFSHPHFYQHRVFFILQQEVV